MDHREIIYCNKHHEMVEDYRDLGKNKALYEGKKIAMKVAYVKGIYAGYLVMFWSYT